MAIKSKNFDDAPIFGGVYFIFPTVVVNVVSSIIYINFIFDDLIDRSGYRSVIAGGTMVTIFISMYIYFKYRGRWKRVVTLYEKKEASSNKRSNPDLVIGLLFIGSFVIMIFAMYLKSKAASK